MSKLRTVVQRCVWPFNRNSRPTDPRLPILLMSARTGECKAILDGRLVTEICTAAASAAAASAVATAHLAQPSSTSLGLIGAPALALNFFACRSDE